MTNTNNLFSIYLPEIQNLEMIINKILLVKYMTLYDDISKNSIILLITSKSTYRESISTIYQEIAKFGNIGYITINKPYQSIKKDLENKSINTTKFFFVDAITATVQAPPIVNDCIFVSSPTALTDIGLAFSSLLGEKNRDLVFFDTISTLVVYEDIGSVIKFAHNLVTKGRVTNKKVLFLSLKEDSETLIKDLNMFVDAVVEV